MINLILSLQKYIQDNGITPNNTIRRQGSVLSLSAMSQASSTSFKLQVCALSVRSGGEYDVLVLLCGMGHLVVYLDSCGSAQSGLALVI